MDNLLYNITITDGESTVKLHRVRYAKVLEANEQAAKLNRGIEILVEATESNNDCPCKYHLGCISPEICKK